MKSDISNTLSNRRALKFRILLAFTLFFLLTLALIVVILWFDKTESQIDKIMITLSKINMSVKEINSLEKDFISYEAINPEFYERNESIYINQHKEMIDRLKKELEELKSNIKFVSSDIVSQIDSIYFSLDKYENTFDSLVFYIKVRGFKDYGLEGKMRNLIHKLEDKIYHADPVKVLTIRRYEKDYIIRKETVYAHKVRQFIIALQNEIANLPVTKETLIAEETLQNYFNTFIELVRTDEKIGFHNNSGLRRELTMISNSISSHIQQINKKIAKEAEAANMGVKIGLFSIILLSVLLNIIAVYFVVRKLAQPIIKLSRSIHRVIEDNFEQGSQIEQINTGDEIGMLSEDLNFMLEKVQERTAEVIQQKEETEHAYEQIKLLSKIGQHITANLDLETTIQTVYKSVKTFMPVDAFGIGIYESGTEQIRFRNFIENEEVTNTLIVKIFQENHLAVKCTTYQDEILIDDFPQELRIHKYIQTLGKQIPESLIYLPLATMDKLIGVIAIHAFEKNAYEDYHLNILRNMAIYISNALENSNTYYQIEVQHKEIEKKNRNITNSLNYAKRIQHAVLPHVEQLNQSVNDYFILFKPRDIVSGDFYWFANVGHRTVIVAADCTGHGVPGAFMSMAGCAYLNQIVYLQGVTAPDKILYHLHQNIKKEFKQDNKENRDGMDLAICVVDKQQKIIEFAGAKNPLVYIQDGEIYEIEGDKMPVGGIIRGVERKYTKHTVSYASTNQSPSFFYMFSDGYPDQFGGEEGKKFMKKRLKELFLSITLEHQQMRKQKEILDMTLKEWVGNTYDQVDDILVVGFKMIG
jgi:serine phosphatase RsbU (regulator of sigma subunit)/predicted PurR-regulated permease PerM